MVCRITLGDDDDHALASSGQKHTICVLLILLAISFVNYLSGYRVDLDAIGRICHQHNVFFLVDAIQGLGVFPLDVDRAHIGALAADGHKWLLGPEGCGIL